MANPSYPAINYRPTSDSWNIDRYLEPIRTEMEGGNVRLRRRPGDDVAVVQQTVWMTLSEYDTFTAFVSSTLGGGTGRFTMNVWLGTSYQSKTVQFEEAPKGQMNGPLRVAVAMKLRVYGVG